MVRSAGACFAALAATLMATSPLHAAHALPSQPPHYASAAWARPALWVVRDADTTIYLFGTFHTLDARTAWVDQRIRAAFDSSNELVLETVIPDPSDVRAIGKRQTVERSGSGTKPTLKPFVAETRAEVTRNRTLGLSVEHGADAVLRRLAERDGKLVSGLETFEEQLSTLASIPVANPPPASAVAAPPPAPADAGVGALLTSWKSGDLAAYDNMLAGFALQSPVAYRMLISDRNVRWGSWIEQRLDRPGTVFVAVGAGHVAGRDGLVRRLWANGYSISRVN